MNLWCIRTDPSNRPTMNIGSSLDSLQVSTKPYLSSPPRLPTDSSISLVHGSNDANINGTVDPSYQACSSIPRTCGDNQTISFPFYIQSQKESFCGYPGFELSCNGNGHPILNLSNDNYIIHQFSYQNQSLLVSNAAFPNPQGSCIPPLQNLTLASEMLELPKQNQVFFLYNCHPPRVPKYEVGCSSENQSNWILGLSGNDSEQVGNLSRSCGDGMKLVVAPVKEEYVNGNESGTGIREAVSRGLELKWKVNYDCKRCEKRKGKAAVTAIVGKIYTTALVSCDLSLNH
ncbi:hypothetical protein FEM48_Zijuj10G0141200 [Ziziphus jujuba var. spinosa]|uniref:non-specific serine/threonine protein kinase n=1 Tax=Ziziphus jujuba var. spinosa TaxID=714518 RepID=A0A978UNU4_ZIZJJ|nr:hypothetical protein FEM48_Zijuj10G0141200 [Ziziphus jujuba var. spinosa]